MSSSGLTPAERTVREARKRRGNALFAARLQAQHGRAPSISLQDFLDEEPTTELDRKYLENMKGKNKRVLVQIMGGGGPNSDEPEFFQDFDHILVDPTVFDVYAELDHVYATYCVPFSSSTSSSLPDAFAVDGYDEDGCDELYTWRLVYCVVTPSPANDAMLRRYFPQTPALDETAVAAEMAKQDNEAAEAAGDGSGSGWWEHEEEGGKEQEEVDGNVSAGKWHGRTERKKEKECSHR